MYRWPSESSLMRGHGAPGQVAGPLELKPDSRRDAAELLQFACADGTVQAPMIYFPS